MNKLKPPSLFIFFIRAAVNPSASVFRLFVTRIFTPSPPFYSFLSLRRMILPFTPSTFVVASRFETDPFDNEFTGAEFEEYLLRCN